jgi:hypothetical protein
MRLVGQRLENLSACPGKVYLELFEGVGMLYGNLRGIRPGTDIPPTFQLKYRSSVP